MKKYLGIIVLIYVLIPYSLAFAGGPDTDGDYYPDSADQIIKWETTIANLSLVKSTGNRVTIIGSDSTLDIANQSVATGQLAGYFVQGVKITPGTYTAIYLEQTPPKVLKGVIQIGDGTWRATGQGNTSYASKAVALAAATDQTITVGTSNEQETLTLTTAITIPETTGTYTLKTLWKSYGTDDGSGVALIWNPTELTMKEGVLNERYILVAPDGTETTLSFTS